MGISGMRIIVLCCLALLTASCTVQDSELESKAKQILSQMTLEEKVGQIIQADISAVTPDEAREYNLGSVLNGGNSAPGGGKVADEKAWVELADAFWEASTDKSDGGAGIPLIWGTDAVHGHNNLQSAVIFPHNIGLGAANDPELVGRIASVTAREVRATGQDWTFAPTLAVAQDDRWGRTYESYSENPDIVASYAKSMVEGLQGETGDAGFLKGEKLLATAKHFVGDGGTQLGLDKGDAQGDLDDILKLHGAGYGPAIDADVQTVMASFSSINGEKMHGHKELLTDVLKGDMGFSGFVVGDWNGHGEIPGCTATKCVEALHAGVDMYMAPDSWKELYKNLLKSAQDGELDLARLDDAVLRILKVKLRARLFEAAKPSERTTSDAGILGSEDHRNVAREAARKSLVLLKNQEGILPLQPGQNILVAGSGASSIQQQTGGWTLNWQGDGNSNAEFDHAQTIFDGLDKAMQEIGGRASLSPDGGFAQRPDVAIVIFGEEPYAEFRGDRSNLVFEQADGANLALLKKFKAQNIPVVSVFLSGRPLWVNPHINASNAFVAAWLPGTEGGGVADLLVANKDGKARHDFTGRLSFTWPKSGSGQPINGPANDKSARDVLFPLGFGLSYQDDGNLAALSEESGVDIAENFGGELFARGDAAAGLQVFLGDSSSANFPVSSLAAESLGKAITIKGVDYKAQEDAREITWAGKGGAGFSLQSRSPLNASEIASGNAWAMTLEWKIDAAPKNEVTLKMTCGDQCSASFNIQPLLSSLNAGQWTTTSIPFSCFEGAGFDASRLETALAIETKAAMQLAIHSVRLEKADNASCPAQ